MATAVSPQANRSPRHRLQAVAERKVRIRDIPQELDTIWAGLHAELEPGQALTRACMSNLIVYCDDDGQAREVVQVLPDIVAPHPSRVVLLTGRGHTGEPGLDVFVSGLYSRLSGGIQVSAELVRVVADEGAIKRLPPVARAQVEGDLPTTLWWASHEPAPFTGELFHQLTAIADQIIYDSYGWLRPAQGMHAMSRWVAAQSSGFVIHNLAWRRLKYWRGLLSQVLDPNVQPGALSGVTAIHIDHGPHAVSMASLLVGWLASLLQWRVEGGQVVPGKHTVWRFLADGRQVPVTLERKQDLASAPCLLRWQWRSQGRDLQAVFADLGDRRLGILEAESDVPVRVVHGRQLSQGAMLAAQMAHRERDLVFERALDTGNRMTGVLLK